MHAYPNIDEVERYITERLLIAGSTHPNVFTKDAIDLIYQCSEGIPRNINNLCDNAMLTAYGAGMQKIGRKIVEEVAENLDLLPPGIALSKPAEPAPSPLGISSDPVEELWKAGQAGAAAIKPRMFKPGADDTNIIGDRSVNAARKPLREPDYFELDIDELEREFEIDGKEVGGYH